MEPAHVLLVIVLGTMLWGKVISRPPFWVTIDDAARRAWLEKHPVY
jgi:hypothetical protein